MANENELVEPVAIELMGDFVSYLPTPTFPDKPLKPVELMKTQDMAVFQKQFDVDVNSGGHLHVDLDIKEKGYYRIHTSDLLQHMALFLKRDLGFVLAQGYGKIDKVLEPNQYLLVLAKNSENFSVKVVDLNVVG